MWYDISDEIELKVLTRMFGTQGKRHNYQEKKGTGAWVTT